MKKRFPKNAEGVRHFRLVARSQYDDTYDNPDTTPLVLEPFAPLNVQRKKGVTEAELFQLPASLEKHGDFFGVPGERTGETASSSKRAHKELEDEDFLDDELDGDCYFPKDGYNYDKHLKRVSGGKAGGVVGVVLNAPEVAPPEVFAKQPATNDDEAEVLRALEHAEEYEELEEDELEDIFPGGVLRPDMVLWGPAAEREGLPDLNAFRAEHQARIHGMMPEDDEEWEEDEEAPRAGRGTEDPAAFEQFLAAEYGDEEVGACDEEEIEGPMSLEDCEEILDEYLEGRQAEKDKLVSLYEPQRGVLDDVPRVIEETKAIIERHYQYESDPEETESGGESEDESKNWDCETILSTLSNVSNRPGKIGKIKVVKKPAPALKPVAEGGGAEEEGESEEEEGEVVELPDVVTTRPRGETPEDRKVRKAAVKELRRVCRRMKKESKEMYKTEAAKLPGQQSSSDIRQKTRCLKL